MTDEPTKTRPGDQPLPTGGQECVQDVLIRLIEERKQLGIQRYGSPLMTHNGRDAGRDMVEEALDLTVYAMQVAMELRDLRAAASGNNATTPPTTCSARYTGVLPVGEGIRAAGHITVTDHTDDRGRKWGDSLAEYPVDADVVKTSLPFPRPAELIEDERPLREHVQAAEEEARRANRRDSLYNLLARLQRGGMTAEEKVALRQHVEAEMRDADTARSVAAGNKRHVQLIVPDLERAQAAIARVRALASRWAVLRAYGGAATELRASLDEPKVDDSRPAARNLVHPEPNPQVSEPPTVDEHTGDNAEDCPACAGTNPPYPFLCPGPDAAATEG